MVDSQTEWQERTRRQQAAIVRIATSPQFARAQLLEGQQLLTEVAANAMHVERCSVWFLEDDGQTLRCTDLYENSRGTHESGKFLVAEEYPNYFAALKSGRAIDASDPANDERTKEFADGYLDPLKITSLLDAAIRVRGEILGVVCFEHVETVREWTPDEISFAGEVADQVASLTLVAEQSRYFEERRELWNRLNRSERQRLLGTLAAGMAHDFNNILTPVVAHAELAQLAAGDDHPVQEHLEPIVKAAERARDLIRQLLALGQSDDGPMGSADLGETTSDALVLARASIPANIDIQNVAESHSPAVALESTQLQQVLLNLIVNGADSMRDKGGVLRVEQSLCHGEDEGYARIRITDQGHGMDKDTLARVFEPFFTTKTRGEGSGLGLAVVHGILEGAGGRIEAKSCENGTTFDVYLPLAEDSEGLSAETSAGDDAATLRVLVVDDEVAVANVLREQLKHFGHEVELAHSFREGLEKFFKNPDDFDMIISDYAMSDSNGVDLFSQARKLRPNVTTILMSGMQHDGEDYDKHVDAFLLKPFRVRELRDAIRDVTT